ncbi:MAG: double zinc ribbon domain-containing protein [Candidatus Binatia bacterium]
MAGRIVDLFFPWRCASCGEDADDALCAACLGQVRWSGGPRCDRCGVPYGSGPDHGCSACLARPPAFRRSRALVDYARRGHGDDPIGAAIRVFKYGHQRGVGAVLSRLLADRFPYEPEAFDVVVPVPLHLGRLRERGFNQAVVLAREPARRFGLELSLRNLVRARPTPAQVGLGERERRKNLRGAFRVREPRALRDRRVLLVDDVVTTLATADACARVLLGAGARSVDVLALARTPLR